MKSLQRGAAFRSEKIHSFRWLAGQCSPDEKQIVRLSSQTNAHAQKEGSYPYAVCCKQSNLIIESAICGNDILNPNGPDGLPGTADDEQCDDSDVIYTYLNVDASDNDGSCIIDKARSYECKNALCGDGYLNTA